MHEIAVAPALWPSLGGSGLMPGTSMALRHLPFTSVAMNTALLSASCSTLSMPPATQLPADGHVSAVIQSPSGPSKSGMLLVTAVAWLQTWSVSSTTNELTFPAVSV